jgi:hypothetical protein
VLEAFVSKTTGQKAALTFLRKLMKRHGDLRSWSQTSCAPTGPP